MLSTITPFGPSAGSIFIFLRNQPSSRKRVSPEIIMAEREPSSNVPIALPGAP